MNYYQSIPSAKIKSARIWTFRAETLTAIAGMNSNESMQISSCGYVNILNATSKILSYLCMNHRYIYKSWYSGLLYYRTFDRSYCQVGFGHTFRHISHIEKANRQGFYSLPAGSFFVLFFSVWNIHFFSETRLQLTYSAIPPHRTSSPQ